MKIAKTAFDEKIETGVTLLFVQSMADQIAAENCAARLGLTCASTRWMHQGSALTTFEACEYKDKIIIARVPQLNHGVRIKCDRVLWVGAVGEPNSELRAVFEQSMGRASLPTVERMVFEAVPHHD